MSDIELVEGEIFVDERGKINSLNNFAFDDVQRIYFIHHPDTDVVRAWQGHQNETNYFYVTKGSFIVKWIEIDNFDHPSKDLIVQSKILTDQQSEVLTIPEGHANGFKALEPDSIVLVFSDMTLEDSKSDNYRWEHDYFNVNWNIELIDGQ